MNFRRKIIVETLVSPDERISLSYLKFFYDPFTILMFYCPMNVVMSASFSPVSSGRIVFLVRLDLLAIVVFAAIVAFQEVDSSLHFNDSLESEASKTRELEKCLVAIVRRHTKRRKIIFLTDEGSNPKYSFQLIM